MAKRRAYCSVPKVVLIDRYRRFYRLFFFPPAANCSRKIFFPVVSWVIAKGEWRIKRPVHLPISVRSDYTLTHGLVLGLSYPIWPCVSPYTRIHRNGRFSRRVYTRVMEQGGWGEGSRARGFGYNAIWIIYGTGGNAATNGSLRANRDDARAVCKQLCATPGRGVERNLTTPYPYRRNPSPILIPGRNAHFATDPLPFHLTFFSHTPTWTI